MEASARDPEPIRLHDVDAAVLVDGEAYYGAFHAVASQAQRSILLLGWQFDSDVRLLRGESATEEGEAPITLRDFLDGLCRARPELEVKILAWDHSVVFAFEREMLQEWVFERGANPRLDFRFDGTVPLGGSHHQKVAIVDGRVAFVGSSDLCLSRWDSSAHLAEDLRRRARYGVTHGPYHEVQGVVEGADVRLLVDHFVERWALASGERLDPARLVDAHPLAAKAPMLSVLAPTLRMPRGDVTVLRTTSGERGHPRRREVRDFLETALREAARFVYIEVQYFTATALQDALVARMRDRSMPPLDVVLVMPRKPEALKDELAMGPPQHDVLGALIREAAANGHRLGVYNVAAPKDGGDPAFVYIHAKLVIVDDRVLTFGSANLTNRSMALDSEMNLAWRAPAGPSGRALRHAIRRLRVRLLLEHLGAAADVRTVVRGEGLVQRLDRACDQTGARIRRSSVADDEPSPLVRTLNELTREVIDPPASTGTV